MKGVSRSFDGSKERNSRNQKTVDLRVTGFMRTQFDAIGYAIFARDVSGAGAVLSEVYGEWSGTARLRFRTLLVKSEKSLFAKARAVGL